MIKLGILNGQQQADFLHGWPKPLRGGRGAGLILSAVLALAIGFLCVQRSNAAGGPLDWSQPIAINDLAQTPFYATMIADGEGKIHLVFPAWDSPQPEGALSAVYYSVLSGGTWSQPNDIFVRPQYAAQYETAWITLALPRADLLGLSLQAGLRNGSSAWALSFAELDQASSATGWTAPLPAYWADFQAAIQVVAWSADERDATIHVLAIREKQLVHSTSADEGATWSNPVPVLDLDGASVSDACRMAIDARQRIHILCMLESAVQDPESPALSQRSVVYVRSTDAGASWSAPQVLQTRPNLSAPGIAAPAIGIGANDHIHLMWNHTWGIEIDGEELPAGRYHTWSDDGGEAWRPVTRGLEISGNNGPAVMAVDSAGTLYLVTAGHGPAGTTWLGETAVWQSHWLGNDWAEPRLIGDGAGEDTVPLLSITGGNRLHVVWADEGRDPGSPARTLWYTTAQSDAPESSIVPAKIATRERIPAATAAPSPGPQVSAKADVLPTAVAQVPIGEKSASQPPSASNQFAVLWGVLPAFVLVLGVVLVRVSRRH